jgi:hypothetical protein
MEAKAMRDDSMILPKAENETEQLLNKLLDSYFHYRTARENRSDGGTGWRPPYVRDRKALLAHLAGVASGSQASEQTSNGETNG